MTWRFRPYHCHLPKFLGIPLEDREDFRRSDYRHLVTAPEAMADYFRMTSSVGADQETT